MRAKERRQRTHKNVEEHDYVKLTSGAGALPFKL